MLTNFHFDEDFLSSDDIIAENSNALNISLLEFWYERGCLVFPYESISKYKEWIQFIPAKHITRWQAALGGNLTLDMTGHYQKITDYGEFSNLTAACSVSGIDLVLVPRNFRQFGLDENKDIYSHHIDLCKADYFLNSPSLQRSKELANRGLLPTDNIDNIWSEQFINFARHAKTITIIDRYFGENICKEMKSMKTSLEKFLELLSICKKKYNITILTVGDVKDSQRHIEIENYTRRLLEKPNISKIISNFNISSCKDTVFRDHAHERYICFENFIFKIDRGMQIFGPYPQAATSISIYRKTAKSTFNHALQSLMPKRLWVF